ncbi:hypothetical protein [Embleya sp. MST-111070]|uniref:hypothetical protein n=1 Tax=Embleya sp. MST-111070 TaxID=3398231 RepID=UPI003F73A6AF
MNTAATIVLIVVIVVLLAGAAVLVGRPMMRRKHLQGRFGPEYDKAVEQYGDRRVAERHLVDRERKHRDLDLKPLEPAAREQYATEWTDVQERFVDAPGDAVAEADALITRLMHERGYPTGAHDTRIELLSVEHGHTLEHYRQAHEIARLNEAGRAETEDLRQAMIHHRALFDDLLGQTYRPRNSAASRSTHDHRTGTTDPTGTSGTSGTTTTPAEYDTRAPRFDTTKPETR